MKLKELLNENWEAKDGKILSNGKLIGYYEFDRGSDSFWVDAVHKKNVKAGVGQIGFDTKNDVINYFKKNEKEAIKHLAKMRESISEAQMHAQTQRESLKMIWQLKVNHTKEPEIIKLLNALEKKIKAYEPR